MVFARLRDEGLSTPAGEPRKLLSEDRALRTAQLQMARELGLRALGRINSELLYEQIQQLDLHRLKTQPGGTINGRWFGCMTPFGLPWPGEAKIFAVIAARRTERDEASMADFLRSVTDLEMRVVSEDLLVISTIHFRPGMLTRSVAVLVKNPHLGGEH